MHIHKFAFLLLLVGTMVFPLSAASLSQRGPVDVVTAFETLSRPATTKAERKEARQILRDNLDFKQRLAIRAAASARKHAAPGKDRSQIVAAVLCFALGTLGVHRFYLGYIGIGVIQLFTVGMFGVWSFVDLIRILLGRLEPKNGSYT